MRIGELAAEAGVNLQTIRFYERRGLLRQPPRLLSGYRVYSAEAVRTIRFIKRCQGLGFKLSEIAELIQAREGVSADASRVRALAEAKVQDIGERIRGLEDMRDQLSRLLDGCTCGKSSAICPALEGLDRPERSNARPSRTWTISA
jgi:MerR family transcriptional regulator, mercuric resistance operon regulatory protein